MPNFDKFERIFKEFLCRYKNQPEIIDEFSLKIFNLKKSNKVEIVKDLDILEVRAFLQKCSNALLKEFGEDAVFKTSSNNKVGYDIIEMNSKCKIELKSGSLMTDGQVGIASIEWAFGLERKLAPIFKDGMKERIDLYMNNELEEIKKSKIKTRDDLYNQFYNVVKIGDVVTGNLRKHIVAISNEINVLEKIKLFNDTKTNSETKCFRADLNSGLIKYSKKFVPNEEITLKSLVKTESRINIIFEGSESRIQATYYFNFKNSKKIKNRPEKIPASHWVANGCFHIWLRSL